MKRFLITISVAASILAVSTDSFAQNKRQDLKPWTQGARQTGKYRNLFAEAGYPQSEIDAKLANAWYTVFEGPNRVYEEVGDDMAYVSDVKNNDVRTEGMSYGMMLAVQWDKQDMFDRLFKWCITYMRHNDPSKPNYGYYAWSCKTDGTRNSDGAASDGELYYITSLIFASNRWGDDGKFNYKAEAQKILNDTMSKTGEGGIFPFINKEKKLISFVPEADRHHITDPSYHLPAFYEIWAEWADDGRADFWRECADEARKYLHKAIDPVSAINPDTSDYDGKPTTMWGNRGVSEFHYDSWRVPMNIAMDYSWYCKDAEWQSDYANRFQNTLYKYGVDKFPDQFGLDGGKPQFIMGAGGFRVLRHSIGIVGTSATASLMATDNKGWEFVDEVWNAKLEPYEDGYVDYYYDGIIYLFALMHLSGNYQIILPQQ